MRISFSILFLFIFLHIQAQKRAHCGFDLQMQALNNTFPEVRQGMDRVFLQASQAANASLAEDSQVSTRGNNEYSVQVVVHVVWRNSEENLSDAIIQNQIDILNQDFNSTNADTNSLRTVFRRARGYGNIQFNLAQIVRVRTNSNFSLNLNSPSLFPGIKSTGTGSRGWDNERFLNIWVVKLQNSAIAGQILGYAFPPASLPNWPSGSNAPTASDEGVVLDFRMFGGSVNPNKMPDPNGGGFLENKGRTAVHEVGHYLGLRHIWGDGGGILGTNDCNQSDGVDDTPFMNSESDFDCNKNKNTCSKTEPFYGNNPPDMVENYMDYSLESCQCAFTRGQVNLMRNVLENQRSDLAMQPVSSSDFYSNNLLSIYPNPANDWVHLAMPISAFHTENGDNPQVELLDVQGKIISIKQVISSGLGGYRMNVSELTTGFYFVRLKNGKEVFTGKIVK
jgi:hypothetical protein